MKEILRKLNIGIKNLISWFNVIFKDRPWDYVFLYEIELKKLNRMLKYYQSYDGNFNIIRDLRICVKLLNILINKEKTTTLTKDGNLIFLKELNLKNMHRFIPPYNFEATKKFLNESNINLISAVKEDIYIQKCINLYNLIRTYKMQSWWD